MSQALQNRDLLRSIGEFEEYQPVEARLVRELRGIFECLGGNGFQLTAPSNKESPGLAHIFGIPANRVVRTEKVGSGGYTSLVQRPLKTGFPHVDSYGESRKQTAFTGIENYYRRTKQERKRNAEKFRSAVLDNADAAARDAVRCLEHAMVVVAGEKNVYRTVVSPSLNKVADEDAVNDEISPFYRKACAAAYSHVVSCVVDRTMDIIETVFLKEGGIGHTSGSKSDAPPPVTVHSASSAAAAGLRMLDGVRMLVSMLRTSIGGCLGWLRGLMILPFRSHLTSMLQTFLIELCRDLRWPSYVICPLLISKQQPRINKIVVLHRRCALLFTVLR